MLRNEELMVECGIVIVIDRKEQTTEDMTIHSLDDETEVDANECVVFHQGDSLYRV